MVSMTNTLTFTMQHKNGLYKQQQPYDKVQFIYEHFPLLDECKKGQNYT